MMKNKIRILHVAQAAGGVDRYIRMLLKYLDKEKFENILVCSQDFHEEDYRDLVDSFEQVEMTRAIGSSDLKAIKEVRALIKKYNPDIVYAHSSKAGAITRVADIGLKNHCIYNPHGWAFNMRCSAKKKAMYTAIEKIAAPFCDKIICISDAEKQSALDKKICKEDKLQVIFNGVDIEAYENEVHGAVKRKDLNIPEDAFVVGMVGRISPQKAPDVFVKMAKHVKDEVPNAHFIIVGNGNQEDEIRKYAEDNDFSNSLHITGWVDNPIKFLTPTFAIIFNAFIFFTVVIMQSISNFYVNIFEALGRNATLTYRTTLWSISFKWILERPWFGYGYLDDDSFNFMVKERTTTGLFNTGNPHNTYLTLLLAGGIVLLAFFIFILIRTSRMSRECPILIINVLSGFLATLMLHAQVEGRDQAFILLICCVIYYVSKIKDELPIINKKRLKLFR